MSEDLQKELDEIDVPTPEPEPVVEPSSESPPASSEPTPAASTEPSSPPEPPPVEPPPAAEPPPSDPHEYYRKTINDLMAEISVLKERIPKEPSKPTDSEVTPKPVEPPKATSLEKVVFVESDDELDKALTNAGNFNAFMAKVVGKIQESLTPQLNVNDLKREVLLDIPEVVKQQILTHNQIKQLHDQFYDVNKDLIPVKSTVAAIANQVHAEHPDYDVEKIFKEAATRTRKVLNIPEPVGNSDETPAFVSTKGSRETRMKNAQTDLQKQLDEIDF